MPTEYGSKSWFAKCLSYSGGDSSESIRCGIVQTLLWLVNHPLADIERARVVRMAQRIAGAHNP